MRRAPVEPPRVAMGPTLVAALVVAALCAGDVARAQTGATPGTPPAAAPTPAPAPPPAQILFDVGDRAQYVATTLRDITQSLADEDAFGVVEGRVGSVVHEATERWGETTRVVDARPRLDQVDDLQIAWDAERAAVEALKERVDARGRKSEADLAQLTRMRETWTTTLDQAHKAEVPASVVGRVEATLAAITETRAPVERRRARVLVLQDSLSRALQACDDTSVSLEDARKGALERLLAKRGTPPWHPGAVLLDAGNQISQLREHATARYAVVRRYTAEHGPGFAASLAILAMLTVALRRARAELEARAAVSPDQAAHSFGAPFAAAVLVTLLVTRPLRPYMPADLREISLALAMTSAVLVLRAVAPRRLLPAVYGLAALFVLDLMNSMLQDIPLLEQVVSIAEMTAAGVLLFRAGRALEQAGPAAIRSRRLRSVGPRLVRILALGFLGLAVGAALGYGDLAHFLGGGLLFAAYSAFAVLAFRVAAGALITLGLASRLLSRLRAVAHHRPFVERRILAILNLFAAGIWTFFVLQRFELFDQVRDGLAAVLEARLRVGELDLSVGRVLGFIAVVLVSWLVTRIVGFLLEEDVYSRMALPRGVPYALSRLTHYALLMAGFFLALATLGLDLTRLTVLVSAFGLGVGFGLQQIISNFVSGLILLFERPVQVGDSLQLDKVSGQVLRIGIRSSTIRTPEGAEVIVPNATLVQEQVTNWTLSDRLRRVDLTVGVAHGTDPERVIALLLDVAGRDARVQKHPEPEALFVEFGASTLDFQLRVWTEEAHWMRLKSDLGVAIQRALRDAQLQAP